MSIPQINPNDYFKDWRQKTNSIASNLGDIENINLAQNDRTNAITAINKIISREGDFNQLKTSTNTSLVAAINNVYDNVGTLSSLTTTAKSSIVAATNEVNNNIGTLSSLTTTEKSSIVAAVNELNNTLNDITFTIGSKNNNKINIQIQLKNKAGNNFSKKIFLTCYISSNSNGTNIVNDAPSGGLDIGTNGNLIELIQDKFGYLITNSSGQADIDITESSAKLFYLVLVLPNGTMKVSSEIDFA